MWRRAREGRNGKGRFHRPFRIILCPPPPNNRGWEPPFYREADMQKAWARGIKEGLHLGHWAAPFNFLKQNFLSPSLLSVLGPQKVLLVQDHQANPKDSKKAEMQLGLTPNGSLWAIPGKQLLCSCYSFSVMSIYLGYSCRHYVTCNHEVLYILKENL